MKYAQPFNLRSEKILTLKILKILHLLSLDVVLGAVFSSILFWRLPDGTGKINVAVLLTLGVATWLVYIVDRLLDLKVYPPGYSPRHHFHYTYHFTLSVLCVVLCCTGIVLCFFIPVSILKAGLILLTLLGGYFLTLNRILHNDHKQWIKEPITAVFYFLAVVGMAFLELPSVWLSSWILALIFFLLVSQNLLLFSWFERFKNAEVINTVSYLGTSSARKIIRGIALVNIILAVFFFGGGVSYVHLAAFTLTLASVFLSFLTSKPDYFLQNERYRWLGDAVFLLPVWLLFV